MSHYHVTIRRTEIITFEVEADSPEQADENALTEGDEIRSKTIELETIEVLQVG
jgi:hypothetical protein